MERPPPTKRGWFLIHLLLTGLSVLRKKPPQVENLPATQFVLPSVQFTLTPAVLCIPDCAKFLGVTPNFIETEMRAGRLAFLFYGGKRVVRISELQRWLDKQEEKSGKLACNAAISSEREASRAKSLGMA
jgi:hypothetical protein